MNTVLKPLTFHHSDTFCEGALLAANLGDDADTTAAIFGELAGAYYGASGIPPAWLAVLAKRDLITNLADSLAGRADARSRDEG